MESSDPFYDYPVLAGIRNTAEMGNNKTAPNEEYPNLEGTVVYSSASITKEEDRETASNKTCVKKEDIETAPNEAYDFIAKEDKETYMKKEDEAYVKIETAPNEAYASGRGFRDST